MIYPSKYITSKYVNISYIFYLNEAESQNADIVHSK